MGFGTAFTSFTRALRDPELTSLELRSSLESPTVSLTSPAAFSIALGSGMATASGESVSEHNALTIATVYACIRLIAEAIGTMPMKVYDTADESQTVIAKTHSLGYVLSYAASPEHTPAVLFETLAMNTALTGNGYLEIIWDKPGIVHSLYPLSSHKTTPKRLPTGELVYETTDGMTNGEARIIKAADVIHVPLFSEDGLKGISPIAKNRETLGLSQAQVKMGARFYGNGSHPGGILTPKSGNLTPTQGQQMREFWEQQAAGVNQGRVAVLPAEMVYQSLGMSMEDSQFLASRAFSRAEIAAMFRISAHMVGDTSHMSNANFEQSSLSLQQDTLQPYIKKIEQEFNRKLLPATGRTLSRYELKFDLSERLRTDYKTTLDALALGRQWGGFSINDMRKVLGMNPIGPAGDVYNQPTNMVNATLFETWNPGKPATAPTVEAKSAPVSALTYRSILRDALGRLTTRTNRTSETFSSIFGPAYTTISDQLLQEARDSFSLPSDWRPAVEKLLKDCLNSTEHRSKGWDTTQLDDLAATEAEKVYRSLRINIFREAGAAVATKE